MSEMPHAGKHHGDAMLVGGVDDFLVAHRAARLGHGGHDGWGRPPRAPVARRRPFGLAARIGLASSATSGATMTSTNWRSRMALAVAASSGRVKGMIPPKGEVRAGREA